MQRRRFLAFGPAGLAAATLGPSGQGRSQDFGPIAERLAQTFQFWAPRAGVGAGAVAVFHHDRMAAGAGLGGCDPETPARMASLSKALTAVAVARLVDAGRLQWNATLAEVLEDDLPPLADARMNEITIRQLVTHRAGLATVLEATPDQLALPAGDVEILRLRAAQTLTHPLEAPPGAAFRYGNMGYLILSFIIARLSAKPYDAAVRGLVLTPAGVTGGEVERTPRQQIRSGAGGWLMSPADYGRFLGLLAPGNTGFGPQTTAFLGRQAEETPAYGLGYHMARRRAGLVLAHFGRLRPPDSASSLFLIWPGGLRAVAAVRPGASPSAMSALVRRFHADAGFGPADDIVAED